MSKLKTRLLSTYRQMRRWVDHMTGTNFPFNRVDRDALQQTIEHNRKTLGRIPSWIQDKQLESSVFNYGLTPQARRLIDLPLANCCTHADLLVYFAQRLNKPVRYLELGVSVGKTFWQVLHASEKIELVGFDIEELNPALAASLLLESKEQWPTMHSSLKKTDSSFSIYRNQRSECRVHYLCGDIFDPNSWARLDGRKFNLLLSDAFHSVDAIEWEWQQLLQRRLLDPEECVIMWDDLDGEMHQWFLAKRSAIMQAMDIGASNIGTLWIYGWLGRREYLHRIGLAFRGGVLERGLR